MSRKKAPSPPAAGRGLVPGPVQVSAIDPAAMQLGDSARGEVDELVVGAELDRVGGAGLGARRLEPILEPVVAEGALAGPAVDVVAVHDAERTRGDAVAAAVADVGLEDHGLVLGADQRSGGAGVEAAGVRAVLAHVRHEHPVAEAAVPPAVSAIADQVDAAPSPAAGIAGSCPRRPRQRLLRLRSQLRRRLEQLDEAHVAPCRSRELCVWS